AAGSRGAETSMLSSSVAVALVNAAPCEHAVANARRPALAVARRHGWHVRTVMEDLLSSHVAAITVPDGSVPNDDLGAGDLLHEPRAERARGRVDAGRPVAREEPPRRPDA